MIRVTVELVPFGVEEDKRTLKVLEIANVGGTAFKGTYTTRLDKTAWSKETFTHWRENDVLTLTYLALEHLGYGDV